MQSTVSSQPGWLERVLAGLQGIARRRDRVPVPEHLATGMAGEDAAFFFLRAKGYIVVARRWSSGGRPGDVDLIAWHDAMLCFIEVKTRTAQDMTPAETAVDRHKRHTLRRLATQYLRPASPPGAAPGALRCDQRLPGARLPERVCPFRKCIRMG